jgi:hypothetical protein
MFFAVLMNGCTDSGYGAKIMPMMITGMLINRVIWEKP